MFQSLISLLHVFHNCLHFSHVYDGSRYWLALPQILPGMFGFSRLDFLLSIINFSFLFNSRDTAMDQEVTWLTTLLSLGILNPLIYC